MKKSPNEVNSAVLKERIFHKNSWDLRNPPLDQILTHLGNWIWEAGSDNFYWTDELFQKRAVPIEEKQEWDPLATISSRDQQNIIKAFNQLSEEGTVSVIYQIKRVDGEAIKITLEFSAILNDQGLIVGLKGCGKKIGRQVYNDGRDNEQSSADHPGLGNFSLNLTTGKMSFARNMFRLIGEDPGKFHPSMEKFSEIVHPDDLPQLSFTDPKLYADSKLSEQYRIYNSRGEVRYLRSYNKITANEKGEKLVNSTVLDVTESFLLNRILREKMAYVDMALDNSVDIIAAFDKELICIAWNNKSEQEYGISKKEALGKPATELIDAADSEKILENLRKAVDGELIQYQEAEHEKQRFFERYFIPLKDENGRIFGVLLTFHDITEMRQVSAQLKELNQSLKHKNAELERSNSELASFSYIASHDLQEPLRKIQTFSRRLIETELGNLSDQGKDYFRRMESASQRMQILIDDLLQFSRTNTLPKDFSFTDIGNVLEEVKADLKEAIEEKNAVIESDELPTAFIIEFQFRQLLQNVISNSLKYARPDRSPLIKIKSRKISREEIDEHLPGTAKEFYRLDISDNGIGFDPQYSERIFGLFQRLHGKHEYPGTGLGLAICQKIAKNHNGTMFATGRPNEGAVFTILIPADS